MTRLTPIRLTLLAAAGAVTLSLAAPAMAQPAPPQPPEDPLARLDTDGDGAITKDEVEAVRQARFAEADTDGDGQLTRAELEAFGEMRRETRKMRRRDAAFETMDANGDGTIGPDEFGGPEDRIFDRLDTDGDGTITAEEREAARDRMKAARGERNPRWTEAD